MKSASRSSLIKQLVILTLVLCVSGVVAYYSAWHWVVKPENQQRFSQLIERNTELYAQKSNGYLTALTKTLAVFAEEIPSELLLAQENSLFEKRIDNAVKKTPQQWLGDARTQWKKTLPESLGFKLFSNNEIETMTSSLRFGRKQITNTMIEYGVSFLFLDMMNRLNDKQLVYTEVAKVPGTDQWHLQHVTAIKNDNGEVQGVLYTILNVSGLYQSWGAINPLLGEITILQKVDKGAPFTFFRTGQTSNDMPIVTKNIPDSYWQVNYQPSIELQQSVTVVPLQFWLITVAFPLLILCIGLMFIIRSQRFVKVARPVKRPVKEVVSTKTSVSNTQIDKEESHIKQQSPTLANDASTFEVSDGSTLIVPETIFRAYDIRGIAYEELSHDVVYAIGQAYATEVLLAGDTSVVVGWDARIHSQEFSVCLIEGIHSTGCNTIKIGVAPTPVMNFSVHEHDATNSGIVITASHNPKEYNGCKMVINGQTLADNDIQRIKERIQSNDVTRSEIKGQSTQADFSQTYIDKVISDVAVTDGWKIVVDAANGASSKLAPRLMNALQCETHALYCQFDGNFPNHNPDPSVAENLSALIDTVVTKQADIGFALDGDGDRLVVVTAAGKIIWPDQLMMIFSQDIVARNPGCDVVFDVKCTKLLAQTISENGGRPIMWKTGHSHIKAKMQETQALLGGEFSGHIFFKERWYGFDDGLYAAARLLEIMTLTGQTADELLNSLPTSFSTPEIKIAISEEKKFTFIDKLIAEADFPEGQKITIDGLRIDFSDGWGLVRASNTASLLTLRFEASNEAELEKIKQQFKQALKNIDNTLVLDF
jgi:phosphomannomutase/phosphoglucomutase